MVITNQCKRTVAVVLLTIFTAYYVNVTFFYHCHTINGVTIVHSHVHNKNHLTTQTSESEVTLISALSLFQTLAAVLFCMGVVLLSDRKADLGNIITTDFIDRPIDHIYLRAPPERA